MFVGVMMGTAGKPNGNATAAGDARGLEDAEAGRRMAKYGYNEITARKQSSLLKFLSKFVGPIPLILWAVIALSYLLGNIANLLIIAALLVFNAIVSFAEEYKADTALTLLKKRLSTNARVLRSGEWKLISARMLVPGDVIRLRAGDMVPADARILSGEGVEVDQSVVTGESLPVGKSDGDKVLSGTVVRRGEATCEVYATGYGTEYGKTARLVEMANPVSHLKLEILKIVKYLMAIDLVVVAALFLYGHYVIGMPQGELILFLLVMFIASVPIALPAAFTVSMALGAEKLADKSILVTKLSAIEEIASMNILCMDKTGTITENKIKVGEVWGIGCSSQDVAEYAAEASREEDKDPIDHAILEYVRASRSKGATRLSFVPFDPSIKRTEARVMQGGRKYTVSKGAPEVIFSMCKLGTADRSAADRKILEFSAKGYRVLAVAKKTGRWGLCGVIALYDRPRPDSKGLIRELRNLGISVKMVTGDGASVAVQIARKVGLSGRIISIGASGFGGKGLEGKIRDADGFAGVYPKDKYVIVKSLQSGKNVIGMTGDGVNDAPALKQAEVGIAVANATDVAKGAADMVLTKSGIAVIVEAVKESRRIFERMITYTVVKIAKVIQIISFIAIIFITMGFVPITAFLLILLIFTNDLANISISTDTVGYSQRPDFWSMKQILSSAAVLGVLLLVEGLLLVPVGFGIFKISVAQFATASFLMLDISDKFTIFNARSRGWAFMSRPSSAVMGVSIIGIIAGILLSYYGIFMQGISLQLIAAIMLICIAFFFIADAVKVAVNRLLDRSTAAS